jgi:hypothetical protein
MSKPTERLMRTALDIENFRRIAARQRGERDA